MLPSLPPADPKPLCAALILVAIFALMVAVNFWPDELLGHPWLRGGKQRP